MLALWNCRVYAQNFRIVLFICATGNWNALFRYRTDWMQGGRARATDAQTAPSRVQTGEANHGRQGSHAMTVVSHAVDFVSHMVALVSHAIAFVSHAIAFAAHAI